MFNTTKAIVELTQADIGRQVRYEDAETGSVLEGPLKAVTHYEGSTQFTVSRYMAFARSEEDVLMLLDPARL